MYVMEAGRLCNLPSLRESSTQEEPIGVVYLPDYLRVSLSTQTVGNATFTQAVLNVINIVTGVGLLSVPFALKRAGWAGLGILWGLGFIMNYTGSPPPFFSLHLHTMQSNIRTECVRGQGCQLSLYPAYVYMWISRRREACMHSTLARY